MNPPAYQPQCYMLHYDKLYKLMAKQIHQYYTIYDFYQSNISLCDLLLN